MSFFIWNVLFATLSAVIGTILGWFIADPQRLPRWIALRGGEWAGQWWCIWQDTEDPRAWIVDGIKLLHRFGVLKISLNRPGGRYRWEGSGVVKMPYFIGEWHSLRPRAHSRGTFTFRFLPQGDKFVGYFVSPTDDGDLVCLAAIITSDETMASTIAVAGSNQPVMAARALRPALPIDRDPRPV